METILNEKDRLMEQIREARVSLKLAIQDENYAEPEFLDIAIERVNSATARLNSLYAQAKLVYQ